MSANRAPRFACPSCGGPLQRVSRSLVDRLIGLVVSSRRYSCGSSRCTWSGLLQTEPPQHGAGRGRPAAGMSRPKTPAPQARRR